MDWFQVLHSVCRTGHLPILQGASAAMPQIISLAELSTPLRQAHFLAQCCEESAGLTTMVEEASGRAYEGRHDLGNVHPGDGVKYKGRGMIELTGRANYALYGAKLGLDLVDHPELAESFPAAGLVAALYWEIRKINIHADADNIVACTEAVNGGLNGLASRKAYLAKAKHALGIGA